MELKLALIGLPILEIAIFIWLLIRKDIKDTRANRAKARADEDVPGRYMQIPENKSTLVEYY